MGDVVTAVSVSAERATDPGVVFIDGEPHSLDSEVGALSLLHGALQSAIGSVDDALEFEQPYLGELAKRR